LKLLKISFFSWKLFRDIHKLCLFSNIFGSFSQILWVDFYNNLLINPQSKNSINIFITTFSSASINPLLFDIFHLMLVLKYAWISFTIFHHFLVLLILRVSKKRKIYNQRLIKDFEKKFPKKLSNSRKSPKFSNSVSSIKIPKYIQKSFTQKY
jgi:hypothetical protein